MSETNDEGKPLHPDLTYMEMMPDGTWRPTDRPTGHVALRCTLNGPDDRGPGRSGDASWDAAWSAFGKMQRHMEDPMAFLDFE